MSEFTVDDLLLIIRECTGTGYSARGDVDAADVPFAELGCDSLALMETASRVERTLDITIPEESLAEIETPGQFVALANQYIGQPVTD